MLVVFLIYLNLSFVALLIIYYAQYWSAQPLKTPRIFVILSTAPVVLFLFLGIDWRAVSAAAVIFSGAYYILFEFEKLKRHAEGFYKKRLSKLEERFQEIKGENERVSLSNSGLEKSITDTAKLYEITKEMSATLLCLDIFEILAKFLKKTYAFNRCKLVLIDRKNTAKIDKIYEVKGWPVAKVKSAYAAKIEIDCPQPKESDLSLVKKISQRREIIKVDSYSRITDMEKDHIPRDIESFFAIPIIVEKELIGLISIENLSPNNFDSFLILNNQFMLEMRKVWLYEKVQELAITDGLTGAFVRRHFLERLEEELTRSKRHGFKFSFLMIDIDHFKVCNDTYGHLVGDAVLAHIVNILKANVRQIDLVGRYGGEEFSVLLPETGKKEALIVAERIRGAVSSDKFKAYDEFTSVTVSIGTAIFPADGQNKNELIEKADSALYRAKNEGRNRVCAF